MKVSGDMVRDLQKRVEVTYEEAERVLLRTRGDLDDAEKILRNRKESRLNKLSDEVGRIYKELLTYYVKVTRKEKTVVDLPLIILVGLFLILTTDSKIWVSVVIIGIMLISESTLSIYRVERDDGRIIKGEEASRVRRQGSGVSTEKVSESQGADEREQTKPVTSRPSDQPASQPVKDQPVQSQEAPTTANKSNDSDDDDYYEITIEK